MNSRNSLTVVNPNSPTVSLPAPCARVLEVEVKPIYSDQGFDGERTVYALKAGASEEDKQRARDSLMALLQPCGPEFASREIVRLRGLTKMKEGSEASLSGAAYVTEAGAYPAEAVRSACRELAGKQTFFPSWAELRRELDRAIRPITDALNAIDKRGGAQSVAEASRQVYERARKANLDRMLAKHGAA